MPDAINGPVVIDMDIFGGAVIDMSVDGSTVPLPAPYYEGDYEVNPDFDGRTLETKDKKMREDVIVHPIFVDRVANPAGGETLLIGG